MFTTNNDVGEIKQNLNTPYKILPLVKKSLLYAWEQCLRVLFDTRVATSSRPIPNQSV